MALAQVLDISYHNGTVNWDKIKSAGVGVIIRCGYGTTQNDKQFLTNIRAAEARNVPYGIYLYSYAKNDTSAKLEAEHLVKCAKQCKRLRYPVYIDVEEPGTERQAASTAKIVCAAVEKAGYYAGIYSSEYWWKTYLTNVTQYTRWVAKWSSAAPGISYGLWQYTSKGNVAGISPVDVSRAKVDFPSIIAGKFDGNNGSAGDASSVDALADAVLAGKMGNGDARKKALGSQYAVVQAIVNKRLGQCPNLTPIAKDVIAGKYGNGAARKQALGSIYADVQALVNKLL